MSTLVDQFIEMVQIDSESGNEAKMMAYLKAQATEMGAQAELDPYGNLIANFPARGCNDKAPILLSCHADTVQPGVGIEPVEENGIIRSRGNTILGADNKAGIAEVFEALRTAEVLPPVEFAVSRQEEVGLYGVKNMDFSRITAKRGFLMDGDTLDTIIIGGPSYYAIDVKVTGRAAHAGMEPEKGISAIAGAARAIAALKLGRIDEETTANVGVIQGGIIRNGVPATTTFLAECRSSNHDKAAQLAEEMTHTIRSNAETEGVSVEIKTDNLCQAVSIPEDSWTVRIAQKALAKLNIQAKCRFITGFTDASIYNNRGIETAVLGIGAQNEHSTEECIAIEDMNKAVAVLIEVLRLSAEE